MNKSIRTISFVAILIVLIYPTVTFAVWWNPFTWFKKKPVTPAITQIIQSTPVPISQPTTESIVVLPTVAVETNKASTTPKPTVIYVQSPQPVVTTPTITQLSISNINITPTSEGARISWNTNIDSESKIILEGKIYVSTRSVGKIHSTDITGLESGVFYGGNITAIANNAWKNEQFNFTTKQTPLTITFKSQNCVPGKCTISWSTNYETSSRITFIKGGDSIKSVSSNDSKNHTVTVNLDGGTYTYEINASTDTEMQEIKGSISVEKVIIPTSPSSGGASA